MRSSTTYTLTSTLLSIAGLTQLACGHTWVESLSVIAPNGTFVGNPGYPRGNVLRTSPGFGDPTMTNLIPPNGRPNGNEILPTDMMCKSTQRNMDQTDGSPRLKAAAGSFVALRYQENGHVTLPDTQPGKPANRGNVYVYGTTQPKPDDALLSIHKVWNSDGSGGDKRGILLATQPYDDGQCYQVNGGKISGSRQGEFKHTASQLMGADLWCQNDIRLPSDAPSGKPYTLYWVWDWPTAPGADPGLPKGKEELYTTCIDVDVTAANQQKNVAKYTDGQPVGNAGIKSYLNAAGGEPTAAVAQSSQQANSPPSSTSPSAASSQSSQALSAQVAPTQQPSPVPAPASYLSMSSSKPAPAPQVSSTAAAVSEIGDGQPQAPAPATSQAPPAASQPAAATLGGMTTVYVTETVTQPAGASTVQTSSSGAAPSVNALSASSGYQGRGSAKFRLV
ncbi:MAG: hypothetical protein M1830_004209 [Pleopsidium flavum]|nr:MAG: hypothetical protein M1830_004209 [Pleopsidium flavum]